MAEFIFKALVKAKGLEEQYYIESAAVSDEDLGSPIYPPAKRCLTQHGVWFDPAKRARRFTRSDYARFDFIIYMDASNLRWIRRIIPDDPEGKIRHMMSFAADGGEARSGQSTGRSGERRTLRDVADPWYTGDFEETYQDLLKGCEGLLTNIPDSF